MRRNSLPRDRFLAVFCATLLTCVVVSSLATAADPPARYAARLANGTRLSGLAVTDWHAGSSEPKLDGKPLLDPANPMRWLRDRKVVTGAIPAAYVELSSGDRLPGNVVGFFDGNETQHSPVPPYFVVHPKTILTPTQAWIGEPRINVVAKFVRRVVWQKRELDQFQPGTLFYRDGRTATFRSHRFGDGLVSLLMEEGQRRVGFPEIAEIHLPISDPWGNYFDELAQIAPRGEERLLQLETADGLIATTSFKRLALSGSTNPNDFVRVVCGIQPAWSLDMLWVPGTNIATRRTFLPHEVPLSRVWPVKSQQRSSLAGQGPLWRQNRNVEQGSLRGGGEDFGWGFGVHAFSELQFDLPPLATTFRTAVGLDAIARNGGCVRARVLVDSLKPNESQPDRLYESEFLVGSEKVAESGALNVAGRKRLTLQFDPAHDQRPAGADPLDIRDMADWFDPLLELDAAVLKVEIASRVSRQMYAWQGWSLVTKENASEDGFGSVKWVNYRDENARSPGMFRLACEAVDKPIAISRELHIGPEHKWLAIHAYQPVNTGQPTKLEIRFDGEPKLDYTFPVCPRGVAEPNPLVMSLKEFVGHKVRIELVQTSATVTAPIFWRAIRIADQLPTLQELFEDTGEFHAVEGQNHGGLEMQSDDRYRGKVAARVTTGGQFRMNLGKTLRIRELPQFDEYRFICFAVRKSPGGLFAIELSDTNGRERPIRMDGGVGNPAYGSSLRTWADQASSQWIVLTRDLFADWGRCDINAVTLSCVAGATATFDQIYLARSREDFDLIPIITPRDADDDRTQGALVKSTMDRILPSTVQLEFADGRRGTGEMIDTTGDIITAGHLLIGPDRPVKVLLPNGETHEGKTRGICRDLNVGLVKLPKNPTARYSALHISPSIPDKLTYIGVSYQKDQKPSDPATFSAVTIRRAFRGTLVTDFDPPGALHGGPLVDQYARVCGVQVRREKTGGFTYVRSTEIAAQLVRLRVGEVYGSWLTGCGPETGLQLAPTMTPKEFAITAVAPNSPAAAAGLQVGDIVKKLNNRDIVHASNLVTCIAEKNPGEEVPFESLRDGKPFTGKLTLAPRDP